MPWQPSYDVYIVERFEFEPIEPGRPYAEEPKDASWSGEAQSPEAAVEVCHGEWRRKYGQDPPVDAEIKVSFGPDVCPPCQGRGWVAGDTYGLPDPGDDAPLGSTAKRTCKPCAGTGTGTGTGTGNITQRR